MQRNAVERGGFAVEHLDVVDSEQGRGAIGRGRFALDVLDLAADIDPAHGFVLHHLVGAAFGDPFAEIHGDDAVGERGDALDAVVDKKHGTALVAQCADQVGKDLDLARRQAGEGLVDQHHFGIARHRFGELHAAQIGERQRPWMPLQNAAQSDLLGDRHGRAPPPKPLSQAATASQAAAPA